MALELGNQQKQEIGFNIKIARDPLINLNNSISGERKQMKNTSNNDNNMIKQQQ